MMTRGWWCHLVNMLCRHVWLASTQHLNFHFNPAGLLSIGDALSFVKGLTAEQPGLTEAPLPGVPYRHKNSFKTARDD